MQSRGWNYRKSNGCHNVKSASTLKLGNKCLYAKFRPQMLNHYKSILVLLTRNKLTLRCKFKFPLITSPGCQVKEEKYYLIGKGE